MKTNNRGKNLKWNKNRTRVTNEFGVTFTAKEYRDLQNEVKKATRRRKKTIDILGGLDIATFGESDKQQLKDYPDEFLKNDFILAKKSKSLHKFKDKKQFKAYMKNLKKVSKEGYIEKRVKQYKRNYIKSLERTLGSSKETQAFIRRVQKVNPLTFMKMSATDKAFRIEYNYTEEDREEMIQNLNNGLDRHLIRLGEKKSKISKVRKRK